MAAVRSEGSEVEVNGGSVLRGRWGQGQWQRCTLREVESRSTVAA
jgi:hypothetical protein